MLLSHSYDVALQYASGLHRRQWRKGTHIPYISHLLAVSSLVMEYGGTETEAIAALLHDAAEDQGGKERLEEIRVHFGEDVARIVNDCTDAWTEPKPDWRPRKEEYIAALEHKPLPSLRARAGITGRWRRCFPEDCPGNCASGIGEPWRGFRRKLDNRRRFGVRLARWQGNTMVIPWNP